MEQRLRQLQLTQLEILKTFDSFCKENDLKYSLFFGTLLGAVRHKGFIPWDDDLDVGMPREDYEKFLNLWEKSTYSQKYILQNKNNSPLFTQTFTKIRKDHTTFIEIESEIGCYHNGIFIDVFPFDKAPDGFLKEKLFLWKAMKYLLFSREYVDPKSNPLIKLISKIILKSSTGEKRINARNKLLNQITGYQTCNDSFHYVHISTFSEMFIKYDKTLFEKITYINFEEEYFSVVENWDYVLQKLYGDYMQLPPKEKQVLAHHPIVIDFENNYEEIGK